MGAGLIQKKIIHFAEEYTLSCLVFLVLSLVMLYLYLLTTIGLFGYISGYLGSSVLAIAVMPVQLASLVLFVLPGIFGSIFGLRKVIPIFRRKYPTVFKNPT